MRVAPLIALTTSELRRPADVRHDAESEPPRIEMALGLTYPEAIERAGGLPLVVPPMRPEAVGALLDRVDGVCIPGGPDIQPSVYGEEPHEQLGPTEPKIDALELALLRCADRRRLPVLGICRGMQMLNVARGGTLHQHLPDVVGDEIQHRQIEHGSKATHRISVADRSVIRRVLGDHGLDVNSFHHQAIKDLGRDLVATAWAPDGVIEAVEQPGERFVLGVQWHAEGLDAHLPLFRALVAAASGAGQVAAAG